MAMDELHGKGGNDDELKKRRVACCVCRSTKEHRCYKCFCGKCPAFTKKLPPRYGQKDRFSDSQPSNSSFVLLRNEETPVSDKVQMDTSAKQSFETSDPCTGDEHPPGFSSSASALRSSSAVRSGTGANGDEDPYSKSISPNSRIESGPISRPSTVKEQRGDADVGNQKVVTNEVDGESFKSHAGSTSVWEILAANEPKASGNQEGWDKRDESVSSWGLEPVKERRGYSAVFESSWGARKVDEPRGNDEAGNQKLMINEVDGGSLKSHDGTSIWDDLEAKESKGNQEGRGNKSISVSGWVPIPANEQGGHSSGSYSRWSAKKVEQRESENQDRWAKRDESVSSWGLGPGKEQKGPSAGSVSSWGARRVEEPRGNDEVGNQKLMTNEVDGGSSSVWDVLAAKEAKATRNQEGWGNKAGSVSGWGLGPVDERRGRSSGSYSRSARREEEPRGNRAGRDSRAGSSSRWSSRNVNEPRRKTDRPVSSWGSRRVEEPRGNEEVRANRGHERSSKPVSPTPHDEFGSRWTSCSGKRSMKESEKRNKGNDVGNQKLVTNEVDGGSSKSHAGSTSIWNILSAKVPKASGNQTGQGNKVGSGSSWGTWPVNAPRGNAAKSVSSRDHRRVDERREDREVTAERAQHGSFEQDSRVPRAETGSRWNSYSGKRSRGDQQNMTNGIEGSFGPVKRPRGNQEIVANTTKDGSSKPELLNTNVDLPNKKPNVESGSRRVQSRGNQDAMASLGRYGSCKSVSHHSPSGSSSSNNVKNPRGNQEATANKAKDKTFKQIPNPHEPVINPHAQSGSSWSPSESRGNPEVASYRAGDGSSEQVLHNHHADPRASLNYVTATESRGNQEITGHKTENGSHSTVPHDLNAGIISNPSSLTAKEPPGYLVSGTESVQEDQPDATVVSENIIGVRGNERIIDPAVASPRHAKPLPVLKDSSYPSSAETFGPVKEVLWKGHFEFLGSVGESYLAHSAAKVSAKAYRFASQIAGNIQFKILCRLAFWPKIFTHDGPDASDIALYFYPQNYERSIKEYAKLLILLEKKKMLLRSVMGRVELLVFPSKVLPKEHQKLKGHYFLWGVFRQLKSDEVACSSQVVPTPDMGPTQVIHNSASTPDITSL